MLYWFTASHTLHGPEQIRSWWAQTEITAKFYRKQLRRESPGHYYLMKAVKHEPYVSHSVNSHRTISFVILSNSIFPLYIVEFYDVSTWPEECALSVSQYWSRGA